jgi:hypothetical protein
MQAVVGRGVALLHMALFLAMKSVAHQIRYATANSHCRDKDNLRPFMRKEINLLAISN